MLCTLSVSSIHSGGEEERPCDDTIIEPITLSQASRIYTSATGLQQNPRYNLNQLPCRGWAYSRNQRDYSWFLCSFGRLKQLSQAWTSTCSITTQQRQRLKMLFCSLPRDFNDFVCISSESSRSRRRFSASWKVALTSNTS